VRGLNAVLDAVAVAVEAGVDGAVVQLQRVEVAVGEGIISARGNGRRASGVQDRLVLVARVLELDP
jgi:hypothetical protein